jgi:carboxypeptidase family protein
MRTLGAIVSLGILMAAGACAQSGSSTAPSSPLPPPPSSPPAVTIVVFTEPGSGFSTSDLRDAQDQIIRFNTAGELIWTADGTRLPGYRISNHLEYVVEGKICPVECSFVVRFGTTAGERRAYLTVDYGHENPGTVVDVEVTAGILVVTQTDLFPPGSPTLSGTVTEMTPSGRVPLEGVSVYRLVTSGWRNAKTDKNGFYQILGLIDGVAEVQAVSEGYGPVEREVSIQGDTRYDIELVRRE